MTRSLIHPWVDIMLLGAGSIVLLSLIKTQYLTYTADSLLLWAGLYCFSFPHFLASYSIFYRDPRYRRDHLFYGVALPVLLVVVLGWALHDQTAGVMEILARLTHGLLFWHYLRQAYGTSLFLIRRKLGQGAGESFLPGFRRALWMTTLVVGASAYLETQRPQGTLVVFGIYTSSFALSPFVCNLAAWLSGLTLSVYLFYAGGKAIQMRKMGPIWSTFPVIALYCWFAPMLSSPVSWLLYPLFHGWQYFPFFYERRKSKPKLLLGIEWTVLVGVAYFLFFRFPSLINWALSELDERRITASIIIFLNLHHYGIDAVIWKSNRRSKAAQHKGSLIATPKLPEVA